MTTKDLEHSIILVDNAAAGLGKTDSSLERSSPVGKMLTQRCVLQRNHLQEEESVDMAGFIVLFLETATATPAFSNHHLDQSSATNIEARPSPSKKIKTC